MQDNSSSETFHSQLNSGYGFSVNEGSQEVQTSSLVSGYGFSVNEGSQEIQSSSLNEGSQEVQSSSLVSGYGFSVNEGSQEVQTPSLVSGYGSLNEGSQEIPRLANSVEVEEDTSELEFSEEEEDTENKFFDSFIGVNHIPSGSIHLEKFLSQGAFGQVYRGQWGELPVALKKIDLGHAGNNFPFMTVEQILESLQWEVSRLSTVSHPNCVQFYGIYQHKAQSRTYLVMEFCTGGTLERALQQKNIPWSKRWQWALEMTQGLVYLHAKGVLHRDLKAENILKQCKNRYLCVGAGFLANGDRW